MATTKEIEVQIQRLCKVIADTLHIDYADFLAYITERKNAKDTLLH